MWAAVINILFGLWLMLAPYVLHFEKAASNNNYIIGPLVITFAIIAAWEVNRSARYFNIIAGAWLVVSPFILDFQQTGASVTTVMSGILIAVLSFVEGSIKGNYGGGWRSLFEKDPVHMKQGQ
jgi:hypothetical protein